MKNRQIIVSLLSMILIISLCLPNGSSVRAAETYSEETVEYVDNGSTEAAAEEEALAEGAEEEAGPGEGAEESEEEDAPEEAVLEEEAETDSEEETGEGSASVEDESEPVEEETIEEETTLGEEKDPAAAPVEEEPAPVEEESAPADEDAVIIEEAEELEYQPKDTKSADDLFAGYVDMEFGIGEIVKPDSGRKRTPAGSKLKADTLLAYTTVSGQLPLLAAGEITSTVFTISGEDLGFTKVRWSADDLGVTAIVEGGKFTQEAKDAATARLKEEYFNLSLLIDALLSDHPYLLYWYDKTQTTRASGYRFSAVRVSGVYYLTFAGDLILQFPVAEAYSAGEYTVDASVGQIVQESVENAQDIVAENMHLPDYDKLVSYRQAICGLTSYNFAAIYNNESYGNPWQLIWVFDDDPSTKVVCEGYSKAFKYLCDQSSFNSSDIDCKVATGKMDGGDHMWNIVTMEDGRNYLVDVTNCDAGMVGADDLLFLIGTEGSPSDGYLFTIGNQNYILYIYDDDMPALWSTEELTLSERNYIPISVENAVISGIEDKVYTGEEITQQVTVEYGGKVLTEETDYTVSYEDNTNAGTARVIIHGIGMYTGNNVQEFTIGKAEQVISAENLALQPYESAMAPVSGAQGTLTFETGDSSVATAANDGTVTAVAQGTTEITVYAAATGNYEAAITEFTVTVTAYDLSSEQCAAALAESSFVYDNSEKKPEFTYVKFGDISLTKDTDYTVSYENNLNAGTGFVTISGNNTTTTGSKTLEFTIEKADQVLSAASEKIVNGKTITVTTAGAQGALTYAFANGEIAQITNDDGAGKIKVKGTKVGTTMLTITAAETENYREAVFELEIRVVPGASTHVEFTNVASGIKVAWNEVEGAKYYKVYRGSEHLFTTSKLCGADTAVKSMNGQKFTYKVVASTTKDSDVGDSTVCRTGTGYRLTTVGITSLTNSAPGKMTVTYAKNPACDKYAVRYGLSEDMSDAKLLSVQGADNLSKTVSALKGKMYYVQVRCYKIVDGKNYYSGFCTTKKLTIKK